MADVAWRFCLYSFELNSAIKYDMQLTERPVKCQGW